MKKMLIIIGAVLLLVLAGCAAGNGTTTPPETTPSEQEGTESETPSFVPRVAVPDGLPVYPDAELSNEITAGEDHWQWLYQTTGSGNDIVEFFSEALQDLGFSIDSDNTFAFREEFFITTTDEVVRVYWLDADDIDNVTADTPGRGYAIVVHLDKWAAR